MHEMGHFEDSRINEEAGIPYPFGQFPNRYQEFLDDQILNIMRDQNLPRKDAEELARREVPAMLHRDTRGLDFPDASQIWDLLDNLRKK
jgi:hypothetical protein